MTDDVTAEEIMVLRIAICDERSDDCAHTAQIIIGMPKYKNAEIRQFCSPGDFIDSLQSGAFAADIAIIPSFMDKMDGPTLAGRINALSSRCQIIFLSAYLEHEFEVYTVGRSYLVLRSRLEEHLTLALDKAMETRSHGSSETITIKNRAAAYYILGNDIEYLERVLRKTRIVAQGAEYWTGRTPEELLSEIDELSFLRCHQSFYVNMRHVISLNMDGFSLRSGLSVPVSRAYKRAAKERFLLHSESPEKLRRKPYAVV